MTDVEPVTILEPVVARDRRPRLDRIDRDAVVHKLERDAVRRTRKRCVDLGRRTIVHLCCDVVHRLRPQTRRALGERLLQTDHRGQLLVFDLHGLSAVLGAVDTFGDHDRHRFADVAHALHGERAAIGRDHRSPLVITRDEVNFQHANAIGTDLLAGVHREHSRHTPRRRRIDPADRGVRIRRAHENSVRLPRDVGVGDVATAAGEKARILRASDRGANAVWMLP